MINKGNVFEWIYKLKDNSQNLSFGDPPYQLGTKYIINEKGEWEVKGKSVDFMEKWEGILPSQWDVFFKESFRFTKYGGYIALFGMEENGAILAYYATKHGFEIHQSLAWYQIEGMPKSNNISKSIDKRQGSERKHIKKVENFSKNRNNYGEYEYEYDITESTSNLGQKYNNFQGGKKTLKPCLETIYVFRKPLKNSTMIDDIFEYENGNNEISPACINIRDNLVPYESEDDIIPQIRQDKRNVDGGSMYRGDSMQKSSTKAVIGGSVDGRYPSQLIVDSECAELLDMQSCELENGSFLKSYNQARNNPEKHVYGKYKGADEGFVSNKEWLGDKGGCSRILHKCDYGKIELNGGDLIYFNSKANKHEKNAGLDEFEEKQSGFTNASGRGLNVRCLECGLIPYRKGAESYCKCENSEYEYIKIMNKNNHPCSKPLKLVWRILNLFKLPIEDQTVFIPFSGSGSEYVGSLGAGFKEENITACEINEEYVEISKARVKYWKEYNHYYRKEKKEQTKIKSDIKNDTYKKKIEVTLFD